MTFKTLFLAACAFALLGGVPAAMADGETGQNTSLSKSDEDFLKEIGMNGTDDPSDVDLGGNSAAQKMMEASDLAGSFAPEEDAPDENVKYVYKGYSETELRRVIKDDRIDDGYVQGLMLQRGSD